MYQVTDGMLDRMAALIARGDERGLQSYLAHIIPQGAPMQPLHDAMRGRYVAPFAKLAHDLAPWLDGLVFGDDPVVKIKEAIGAAGYEGLSATEIRPYLSGRKAAFEWGGLIKRGEVVAIQDKTGGRPSTRYRLASAKPAQADPFAWTPPKA